jgi:hypothetical protein
MSDNELLSPQLYDVLGQDCHRYFVGVIMHKELKKYYAPIPAVRLKATGMLIDPASVINSQQDMKQNIIKELIKQLANGAIKAEAAVSWYDSPIEAAEANLYHPPTSCQLIDID